MKCNAERLIEALIAMEVMQMQRQEAEKKEKLRQKAEVYVVTVSRDFGSMGKLVAQLLADVLEVRCCDRFILQDVARRAHVDEKLVKALDEHVSRLNGHWWQQLLHKDVFSYEDYYHYLVKTVLAISRTGGVIIGRGANHILGAKKAFRVRIIGSVEQCAKRVASRENISTQESIKLVREVNIERAEYIKMLYDADINNSTNYDLILNSDRYDRVQMVELILDAMEKAGYKLPDDARKSLNILSDTPSKE
jgi:ATP-dependent Clp protease adapter protein ClpS